MTALGFSEGQVLPYVNSEEIQYLDLMRAAIDHAQVQPDRTGTGRHSLFGATLRFRLDGGRLPVITTKRVWLRAVVHELMWFISGSQRIDYLREHGVEKIWEPWARGERVGRIYGAQWREWCDVILGCDGRFYKTKIDQLNALENRIRQNPFSRRHIMTTWHVGDAKKQRGVLPPCHGLVYQVCVDDEGGLHAMMYQRSADLFIGVPFNITSYALLTHMLAHTTGYNAASLTMFFGDAHVYANHLEAIDEQLSRQPFPFPTVSFNDPPDSVCHFNASHAKINGYKSHSPIKAEVAV